MDMMPNQAPPAISSDASPEAQQALAAIQRLLATRQQLIAWQALMPEPPAVDHASGVTPYITALADFWSASDAGTGLIRRNALAAALADTMRDEAALRTLDGSLDERSAAIVKYAIATRPQAAPPHIELRELTFGDVAYAGSLIVLDDREPDVALLFLPDRGWESFLSLEQLLDHARQRFEGSLRRREVTEGISADDLGQSLADRTIGSRIVTLSPFERAAQRMVDVQAEQLAQAWSDYRINGATAEAATHLADRMREAATISNVLDITALLDVREARLLDVINGERLAQVPAGNRAAWHSAARAYDNALYLAGSVRDQVGIRAPETLLDFATGKLRDALKRLGIDDDPADIDVTVYPAIDPSHVGGALDYAFNGPQKATVPLIQLAFQNIGRVSADAFQGKRHDGQPLAVSLTTPAVRQLIAGLDLAATYEAHLTSRLQEGAQGSLARLLAMDLEAARMLFEAEEARVGYYTRDRPGTFIPDHSERGFKWVEAALASRSAEGRAKVEGHDIAVSQVTYKDSPVSGVLMLATRQPASASRIVLYTPGAPDGIAFREFADRQEASKQFFYHPDFREYLLDRLPMEYATMLPNGVTREFRDVDHRAAFVFGVSSADTTRYTRTAEPFREREIRGDFLGTHYDTVVELRKRDARYLARTDQDADWQSFFDHPFARIDLAQVTRAMAEIPASAIRAVQAAWRMEDHLRAGSYGEAFVAFTDTYTNALNAAAPYQLAGMMRHTVARSARHATRLVDVPARSGGPMVSFESRYQVRGIRTRGAPDAEGIYHVDGKAYVKHEGKFYGVRRDDVFGVWRLARQGELSAHPAGPAIEQVGGRWAFAQHVGVCGGMRRSLCSRFFDALNMADDAAPAAAVPGAATPEPAVPGPSAPVDPIPRGWGGNSLAGEQLRQRVREATRDNPTSTVRLRTDGQGFHLHARTRSAMWQESNLNPDLATLSRHQRRQFYDALERLFPSVTERGQVINELGWLRWWGRRLPSPDRPPTGAAAFFDDGMDVTISSTTGDFVPESPNVTPAQRELWNIALNTAREAPRVPLRLAEAAAGNPQLPDLPGPLEIVTGQWPERLYYYSYEVAPNAATRRRPGQLDLARAYIPLRPAEVRLTTLGPVAPTNQLDHVLGIARWQRMRGRDPLGRWASIDTAPLRRARGRNGLLQYTLHRRVMPGGEYEYTLRSADPEISLPAGDFSTGSRTGAGVQFDP